MRAHEIDLDLPGAHVFQLEPEIVRWNGERGGTAYNLSLLVGHIAAGKSTVVKLLATQPGFAVIDADKVSKDTVYVPEHYRALEKIFGATIFVTAAGKTKVDFVRVADLFFPDPTEEFDSFNNSTRAARREAFMDVFHELILSGVRSAIQKEARGGAEHIVIENAIGLAAKWDTHFPFDEIICVACNRELQAKRHALRYKKMHPLSGDSQVASDLECRLGIQWSLKEILQHATLLVLNNGDEEDLQRVMAA